MTWGVVRLEEQRALVFSYEDAVAGPSAKGARLVGDEPTEDEARAAIERPDVTIRLEPQMELRPLAPELATRLGLSTPPSWVESLVAKPKGPWSDVEGFQGFFHPVRTDELQVTFLTSTGTAERRYVRLDTPRPELEAWEGELLQDVAGEPLLELGARVVTRPAPGGQGPVWMSAVTIENLRTFEALCQSCGFDLIVDPAEPLSDGAIVFVIACAGCGQPQDVARRIDDVPGAPVEETKPASSAAGALVIIVTAALLALTGLAWWLFG